MKILHIIPSLDMGGAEQLTINLAHAQKQSGHDVALCCVMSPPEHGTLYQKVCDLGLPCYYSYAKHEPRMGLVLKLSRLIRHLSPDVVQSHLPRANAVSSIAARLSGVPCVISTFHNPYIWKNKRQVKWGRWTSFLPDGFFCDANSIRKRLIELSPRLERKIRVVYPALPFHETTATREEKAEFRQRMGIREKERLVGVVARLAEVKNHGVFIDAAQIVLKEEKDVRFIIAGDGLERERIINKIREKNLEDRIHVSGYVSNLDVIWSQLDIFALTSISEGFTLSVLEALQAGIPVVASEVGGVPEIVKHGENGFLSPPDNPQSFAENITRLLKDNILLEKIKRNAQESVQPFRMETMVEKTLEYYKELSR